MIFGLIIAFLHLIDAEDCETLAEQGDCLFYRECVERRIPAGEKGYALNYGEKYCKRFEEKRDCFNSKGQVWVENVKSCLTTAIITSEVYKNGGSHDELMEFSFNSHTVCYNDNQFCTDILVSYHNLKCLLEIFSFKDFLTKHAIKQNFCSEGYLDCNEVWTLEVECTWNRNA